MNKTYKFTLFLPELEELNSDVEEKIFQSNCEDGLICYFNKMVFIIFRREGISKMDAVNSAVEDLKRHAILSVFSAFDYKTPIEMSLLQK